MDGFAIRAWYGMAWGSGWGLGTGCIWYGVGGLAGDFIWGQNGLDWIEYNECMALQYIRLSWLVKLSMAWPLTQWTGQLSCIGSIEFARNTDIRLSVIVRSEVRY